MKLENYEVHLPSYSIGDHIYDKIGPVCESYGKTVLLIGGRRALKAAEEKIRTYVAKTNLDLRNRGKTATASRLSQSRYGLWCGRWKSTRHRKMSVYH